MLVALSLAGLWIHQQVPEPPRTDAITWEVPSECPDRASLLRAIARRLGRPLAPGAVTLVGRIDGLAGSPRYRLRLELTVAGRTQVRTLTGERCRPLVDATALLVAVSLAPAEPAPAPLAVRGRDRAAPDPAPVEPSEPPPAADGEPPPAADGEPPPELPSATPEPDPTPPDATTPTAPDPAPPPPSAPARLDATPLPPAPAPSPSRRRPGALVRLHGGPEYGAVPGPTGALGLAAGLLWKRARLEVQGTWLAPRPATRHLSEVRVSVFAAAVHGCARLGRARVEFPLCGGLEFGAARGRGRGPGARTATGAWLAGVVSAGVAWHPHPLLSLSLALQGVVPLVWPRFEVRDEHGAFDLFEARPVDGRLLAGLEWRLGDPW
jgi:hypothetical protein